MFVRRSLGVLVAGLLVLAVGEVERTAAHAAQPSPDLESCPDPADPVEVTSVADVEQRLVGTWLRCGDAQFLVPDPEPVGVELTDDGRFYSVYPAADGGLVRVEGLEQEGTWTVIDSQLPSYQLDLSIVGLGTAISSGLGFFESPAQVRFVSMLGDGAAVRWTGDAPRPGPLPSADDGPCGVPRDPLQLTSVADVEQRLVGTWVRCGESSAVGLPFEAQVGLEFVADRQFFRVYRGGDGIPIRGEGDGQQGTWEVVDTSSVNGPGSYQLNLTIGGFTAFNQLVFLQDPVHLRLVGMETPADYQPWNGEPLPALVEPPPPEQEPPDTQPTPAPSPSGGLPETGVSPSVIVLLGLACVAVGIVLRRSTGRETTVR